MGIIQYLYFVHGELGRNVKVRQVGYCAVHYGCLDVGAGTGNDERADSQRANSVPHDTPFEKLSPCLACGTKAVHE